MEYRVVIGYNKIYPFKNYSEALLFQQSNNGKIYEKVYHCGRRN